MDGQSQRRALTAAEQAIQALGAGDGDRAVAAARRAAELDQVGAFADLVGAVAVAAADLTASGAVGTAAWDGVAAAVGPGPLAVEVEALRDA